MKNIKFIKTTTAGIALSLSLFSQSWAEYNSSRLEEWLNNTPLTGDDYNDINQQIIDQTGGEYNITNFLDMAESGANFGSSCGANCSYLYIDPPAGVGNPITIISGSGTVESINERNLGTVIFTADSNFTKIGIGAFQYEKIDVIDIPDSVTEIDHGAFQGVIPFDHSQGHGFEINFGENSQLETISEYAFRGSYLTNIDIPDSVTSIGDYAFEGIGPIDLYIPDSVKSLGSGVLDNAVITSLTLGENIQLEEIGGHNGIFMYSNNPDAGMLYGDSFVYPYEIPSEDGTPGTLYLAGFQEVTNRFTGETNYEPLTEELLGEVGMDPVTSMEYTVKDANGNPITRTYTFETPYVISGTTVVADASNVAGEQPKRRIYTVQEAEEALGKKNKNTFSIKYR